MIINYKLLHIFKCIKNGKIIIMILPIPILPIPLLLILTDGVSIGASLTKQ